MSDGETKAFVADYPFDLPAEKQLIFVYSHIIEYQHIGDTKTPLIRVLYSKQRLKTGSLCEIKPTNRKFFSNLEHEKWSNNLQFVEVQLTTETGKIVPFTETGKVILT